MGRKPSNVYDYFVRLEPESGAKGLVRYQCKKCAKQYASNATRLADHLKLSCAPGFQTNQRSGKTKAGPHLVAQRVPVPVRPATQHEVKSGDEEEEEVEGPNGTVVPAPSADTYTTSEDTPTLALKRADQQLLTKMLESEHEPPQDVTEVLLRLAKLSTGVISDAMDQLNIRGYLLDVNLVRGYDAPLAMNICGPALTVQMMPITGAEAGRGSYDYMDTAEMGQVVVISAPTGVQSAVFGGLLATASKARNVAGVVTDGRVRDVQELCTMNFPAFATGTSVRGLTGSTTIGEINGPIVVAGCAVHHNDIIRGDINGVVVIPAERAQDIAARAELIEDQDNKIIEALNEGEPMQRSLHRFRSSRDV
ncbi:Demethylmenaquinone methyltransferase [Phytophthora megakarya]|uniref:Demethylmenaquinone methyltransferase n=1 Tax=Phytophthora megakarya TaxID=4795 RepID=A0A225W1E1_9STRA|nr:Demethylmenaquinone methyltransferase [Phytophthora megakarya]